jgi:hypothetical protein
MTGGLSEIGWLKATWTGKMPVMKATAKIEHRPVPDITARVDAIDWTQVTADLDGQGCAVLKGCCHQTSAARSPRSIPMTRASAAAS